MDFFQQQEKARKKTKWLVLYFSIAVILIIAAIYCVVVVASFFVVTHRYKPYEGNTQFIQWDPELFLFSAAGTLIVILGGCAYKIQQLAEGGSALAESLGGRLVSTNTTDADERRLLNVIEEMSIASSVPMPQVYVLDEEQGINAFAAGHSTSDAVVAVTHGCLKLLNRDELQGVIGHEFSHVLNGDMRLNLRLIGILFGILCLATLGRIFLQMRSRGKGAPVVILVGGLLFLIGSIGVFFGRLIQAAVSRQREFLADASSVQFTRNPLGISGALQKIGGYGFGSSLTSENAPDAGHIFFGNGIPNQLFGMMATHPPLEERIRAVDQTWDGKFPKVDLTQVRAEITKKTQQPRPVFMDGKMIVLGGIMAQGAQEQQGPVKKYALPNVGNPTPLHLKYAEQLRDSLPDSVRAAVREPLDATALMYAIILSSDDAQRSQQVAGLQQRAGAAVSDKAATLYPEVSKIATHVRLPMVNVALGALKQLTGDQYNTFSKTLDWLINSDGEVELFEFVLQKIVLRHLDSQFHAARKPIVQFYSVKPLVSDCALLLSALANLSSNDSAEVQKAFDAGAPYLRAPDDSGLQLVPRAQCGLSQVDTALNRLLQGAPNIKKNLLDACLHVIAADGVILETEAELLRAIADTLDCPVPPFVATN
ncbi:MAG TPA: M48 family metallopeptidase [Verrucomicrobiae bacterium]|jgi:Zn-dependent protease with chaperone function